MDWVRNILKALGFMARTRMIFHKGKCPMINAGEPSLTRTTEIDYGFVIIRNIEEIENNVLRFINSFTNSVY